MKKRYFPDKHYRAIYHKGKTLRFNDGGEMQELDYPEFFDIKITNRCNGKCPYCYQNSIPDAGEVDVLSRFVNIFDKLDDNQKPFQIAFDGGEPTMHYQFIDILRTCSNMGITPNYTTNGQWVFTDDKDKIVEATLEYCEGVAISCHPHLDWETALMYLIQHSEFSELSINLHVVISDKLSIDKFFDIYSKYKDVVDYFVLLPYEEVGRAQSTETDFQYLFDKLNGTEKNISFGANFYSFLCQNRKFKVSLYEPEMLSKYIDLTTNPVSVYRSSFSSDPISLPMVID